VASCFELVEEADDLLFARSLAGPDEPLPRRSGLTPFAIPAGLFYSGGRKHRRSVACGESIRDSRHKSPHSQAEPRSRRGITNRCDSLEILVRRAGIEPARPLRDKGF
jgi:hypothetical protein